MSGTPKSLPGLNLAHIHTPGLGGGWFMVFMVSISFYGGGSEDKLHHICTVTFCHLTVQLTMVMRCEFILDQV